MTGSLLAVDLGLRTGLASFGAEEWRAELLFPREQRTGRQAKIHAGELARRVIEWSGAARPTSLRHDAAEAIAVGLWGVLKVGLLDAVPMELRR